VDKPLDIDSERQRLASLEQDIAALKKRLGVPLARTSETLVACPACGKEMVRGTASIQQSLSQIVFTNFSQSSLVFERRISRTEEPVKDRLLDAYDRVTAYHCPACGVVTLKYRD